MSTTHALSEFYGKTVKRTEDLIFDACCVAGYDQKLLEPITDEVKSRRYGCGSPLPEDLEGKTVLDLGCGAGIDCFIASQLVKEQGWVIGVDMTDEQLSIANRNIAPITKNLGYREPNVEFRKGRIEEIPADSESVDVVISNCVLNLSLEKEKVFREIHRILKPGGEFYIADIVADRRIPEHLQKKERLFVECLTGAAYTGDLWQTMRSAGFNDVRSKDRRRLKHIIEGIGFESLTLRGFKIPLEERCEDYGQVAVYLGSIAGHAEQFVLDEHHPFPAGKTVRICKNTADILNGCRLAPHFKVSSELLHLGPFDCAASPSTGDAPSAPSNECCG